MMAVFANLEDTPMFRKHLYTLEHTSDDLKDRCQKFQKGCKRFMTSLGGACDGDLAFAECMEAFGAGCDDPISVAIGGPVMSKFTTTFRELGTYKELLRSQVEHMLSNRLLEFVNTDIRDAKDSRRRFDKAQLAYDQAREKVMSLKKGTRPEVVAALEEDLHNSKSSYERCRFNLVNALANIEAKKKYEFLESISAVMDAHLRYFKQGYELLSQMEQFIHQVLTYTQQSKEMTRIEHDKLARRIQEYRTHEELDSSRSPRNTEAPTNGDGIHIVGINSYKSIEALMQSSANGEVQTIKQGYLLKQSSSVRGDWKRRFFVLDSHGTLYYYRNKRNKHSGTQQQHSTGLLEHGAGVFGRFRFSHSRSSSHGDENLSCHIVNLQTSTVKIDAEQTDLRFCFRIISPHKSLTLQAENEAERTEWVDKVTAVIASLLNSSFLNQPGSHIVDVDSHCSVDIDGSNFLSSKVQKYPNVKNVIDFVENDVSNVLKNVLGNDVCAECSYPEPGWASLNLGVLICIECSGVHRNLGVHISKVRSLTLDVKVWEQTVLDLFCALGNSYCNSVWEELLTLNDKTTDTDVSNKILASITKPGPRDAIAIKEKYIQQKYVEKCLVVKETSDSNAIQFREAVICSKIKEAYRLLVISDVNPNITFDMVNANDICDISGTQDENQISKSEIKQYDPANCPKMNATGEPATCLRGCSSLHLACHMGNLVMVELLLQFGADINMQDFHGRTPLHHCVFARNSSLSKYLIRRGASPSIKDGGGETPLERAMKYGPITDEELFLLLVESD